MKSETKELYSWTLLPPPEQAKLNKRVLQYIAEPTAIEHEALRSATEAVYGPTAARFFDEAGTLPLVNRSRFAGPEWPMHPWEFESHRLSQISTGVLTSIMIWILVSSPSLWSLVAAVAGGALAAAATRAIRKRFPPRDLPERSRLMSRYLVMTAQQDHLDELARAQATAEAEAESVEARVARLSQTQQFLSRSQEGPAHE